jgi:hypothetical protein
VLPQQGGKGAESVGRVGQMLIGVLQGRPVGLDDPGQADVQAQPVET